MARPVCKGFFEIDGQSVCFNVSGLEGPSFRPRWRYARSGPHKSLGVERRFLGQASRTPFDCLGHLVVTLSQTSVGDLTLCVRPPEL